MGKKKSKAKAKSDKTAGETQPRQDDRRSSLEQRREALQSQVGAVEAAELKLNQVEQDVENNTIATRQQESAMEAATARVADLEKALKGSGKERKQLQAALKEAKAGLKQAREEASAAEARYEKAVLKEVVRREKVVDLTVRG